MKKNHVVGMLLVAISSVIASSEKLERGCSRSDSIQQVQHDVQVAKKN